MPKSDGEKAEDVLKKRDLARKGLSEQPDRGKDPLEEQENREDKVGDAGLAVGIGMNRS